MVSTNKLRIFFVVYQSLNKFYVYNSMQDADYCVTLFKREAADSEFPWTYLGKHRAHYKPIRGLTFGLKLDTTAPRLLSVGEDRSLVSGMLNLNIKD